MNFLMLSLLINYLWSQASFLIKREREKINPPQNYTFSSPNTLKTLGLILLHKWHISTRNCSAYLILHNFHCLPFQEFQSHLMDQAQQ